MANNEDMKKGLTKYEDDDDDDDLEYSTQAE